ncbi:MAG TPA: RNA polymerase sigma factor [Clostridia bacterium]|nr:RNA polymerase sigma factor [Clostridia bacterium]
MHVEASIIARCKKHDKAAFVELFKMYERYLFKLCYSYVQNQQDALDITQEVYIKVFKNISKFDEKMPFHPWFRAVTVNTCINFKRVCRYDSVSLNSKDEDDKSLEEVIPAQNDVENEVLDKELGRLIRENLEGLKPKHRMVLVLRYYEGLSYEEISVVLKEPLGTVKTDIYRARNILKEKLRNVLINQNDINRTK